MQVLSAPRQVGGPASLCPVEWLWHLLMYNGWQQVSRRGASSVRTNKWDVWPKSVVERESQANTTSPRSLNLAVRGITMRSDCHPSRRPSALFQRARDDSK